MTTALSSRPRRVVNRRRPPVSPEYPIPRPVTREEAARRRAILREFDAAIASDWISASDRDDAMLMRGHLQSPEFPVAVYYRLVENVLAYWRDQRRRG